LWPLQIMRIAVRAWLGGHKAKLALAYGFFIMLSYWPQMVGQIMYRLDRMKNLMPRLIEYKNTSIKN